MERERVIVQIYGTKSNQMLINVPKKSNFKPGMWVELVEVPNYIRVVKADVEVRQ